MALGGNSRQHSIFTVAELVHINPAAKTLADDVWRDLVTRGLLALAALGSKALALYAASIWLMKAGHLTVVCC